MRKLQKPTKMELLQPRHAITTQDEWEKLVKENFAQYKKLLRKHQERGDGVSQFDLTDSIVKRRQKAILNTIPEIYKRYAASDGEDSALGETWTDMNIPFTSYSQLDTHSHILFAASMWVLEQIAYGENWREMYRYLPTDEHILDELCLHDVWDTEFDYDLIYSVEHVLRYRNGIETDSGDYDRVVTSNTLAAGKVEHESFERSNYDALIALIPQEAIDIAVDHFREHFWQWVDRYFKHAAPFLQAETDYDAKIHDTQLEYNRTIDELYDALGEVDKLRKKKKVSPLMMGNMPKSALEVATPSTRMPMPFDLPHLGLGSPGMPVSDADRAAEEAFALGRKLDGLGRAVDSYIEKANDVHKSLRTYSSHITRIGRIMRDGLSRYGEVKIEPMEPMRIEDPYELCFALLYLVESGDDIPWLYGACNGLMGEVVETLPWGIIEYDELDDDVWGEGENDECEPNLPKSITIPDWYERNYRMKGDDFDFPRNLAQILYEETGCILPRDLHLYDSKAKMLGKYGIKGKDAAAMLMLMTALGTTRRSNKALNLKGDVSYLFDFDAEEGVKSHKKQEQPEEDADTLKAEVKRLREALHEADRENRDAKKTIAGLKTATEREHRELADLREYVFNQESDAANEDVEDATNSENWPYEVRKNTMVFGGHATWAKGIKSILTGNIRFIDKDLVFDTEIVKHTDVIWIQPNAISHSMYWRVMDTARAYKKQVRYFAFASWAKCAEQVVGADQ